MVSSLKKLEHQVRDRNYKYSLWQTEKNVLPIFSEKLFMEKLNYIHQNPVRAGLVEEANVCKTYYVFLALITCPFGIVTIIAVTFPAASRSKVTAAPTGWARNLSGAVGSGTSSARSPLGG